MPAAAPGGDRYTGDWSVADIGPEEWRYARTGTSSRATLTGAGGTTLASLSCAAGMISISRTGAARRGAAMAIRNSFAERSLPLRADNTSEAVVATLDARDPLWDQVIYSRGRFVIEVLAVQPLIAPVRPEIARVVEDCRG